MPDPSPSHEITLAKSSFLTTQIRLLKSPLASPDSPLPAPTTQTLLDKINKKIAHQGRQAYSLESQRHIVEQIDTLYWRDVLSEGLPVRKAETVIRKDADLTGPVGEWNDIILERPRKRRRTARDESGSHDKQEERYNELRAEVARNVRRRNELQEKLERYKKLKALLEPFTKDHVQPNLMTRDNKELAGELTRTRVLLARVASAVQDKAVTAKKSEPEIDAKTLNARKLDEVLGMG